MENKKTIPTVAMRKMFSPFKLTYCIKQYIAYYKVLRIAISVKIKQAHFPHSGCHSN